MRTAKADTIWWVSEPERSLQSLNAHTHENSDGKDCWKYTHSQSSNNNIMRTNGSRPRSAPAEPRAVSLEGPGFNPQLGQDLFVCLFVVVVFGGGACSLDIFHADEKTSLPIILCSHQVKIMQESCSCPLHQQNTT